MDLYESLLADAQPVYVTPQSTSYFSPSETILDPRLFRSNKIIPAVRDGILATLFGFLEQTYTSAPSWALVWLAGSGVSYQWSAHRDPGDLDCLIGIDYIAFRQSNESFKGLSNQEIASMLNEHMRVDLWPTTEKYLDSFELTFYINAQSDIRKIQPYAAYSLTTDDWTVVPTGDHGNTKPPKGWELKVNRDRSMASDIVMRYQIALGELMAAQNDAARRNAESKMTLALGQATALFEDIHKTRSQAFSESGKGYSDYANYRWQYGKEMGVVPALKEMREYQEKIRKIIEHTLYGQEMPTPATLVRRAALHYRSK